MSASFELEGQEFFALNGGPQFQFTPAISFFVNCETQQEVDELWEKLSAGREKNRCGWLRDKYGLSWQIIPTALGEMLLGDQKNHQSNDKVMKAMLQMDKIDIKGLKRAHDHPSPCHRSAYYSESEPRELHAPPSRLPSRGRARSSRDLCASGGRLHPTTDAAHASNAPAHCAIHDARGLLGGCGVRVSRLRAVEFAVWRGRPGADIALGLLPEGAALQRK